MKIIGAKTHIHDASLQNNLTHGSLGWGLGGRPQH